MQKGERCSGTRAFVSVDESLAFGEVIGIRCGDAEQIGIALATRLCAQGARDLIPVTTV